MVWYRVYLKFCVGMVGVVYGMLVYVVVICVCFWKFKVIKNFVKMSKLNFVFY